MSDYESTFKDPAQPAKADSFGEVAIRLGYVSEEQINEAMATQSAYAQAGLPKRIGEVLLEKQLISAEQINNVVRSQTVGKKRIGDYELISKLGEGGMGAVFKAKQLSMDRLIALKILAPRHAGSQDFRERFQREARAIAKLNHPNIVTGIDAGEADGYCYFAMEFVDGDTLGQLLRRSGGKLPERDALLFIKQIAQALKHAHENNLLHRDVKPDNILIDKSRQVAKLADLGLAREADTSNAGATKSGQAVGTPFYMSPEQARGKSLGPATDLYSLGATLFHLLTGSIPFPGATAAVIMARHITDTAPDPRDLEPSISKGAAQIINKCLKKEPEKRYTSAGEILKDIDRVLSGGEPARVEPVPSTRKMSGTKKLNRPAPPDARDEAIEDDPAEIKRPKRRRRLMRRDDSSSNVLILAAVLGVVILGGLFYLYNGKKPPPKKTPTAVGK